MKLDLHEYKQYVTAQITHINAIADLSARLNAANRLREKHDHIVALHGWTGANCAMVYAAVADTKRALRRERIRR